MDEEVVQRLGMTLESNRATRHEQRNQMSLLRVLCVLAV